MNTSRQIPFVLWFFVTALFLLPSQFACKTINQKGVTCKYNFKGKKTTPLGGVFIKVASANAVKSDSETGEFILVFKDGRMGNRIDSVKFSFGSMKLFNQQAVDEWNIRNEPLKLILCDAAELEQEKQKYIKIGRKQVEKEYDQKIADVEKQYQNDISLLIKNSQKVIRERDSILSKVEQYSEKLARVDRSTLNAKMEEVMTQYENGGVEKALQMLDKMDNLEQYKKAKAKEREGKEDANELYKNLKIEFDLRLNIGDSEGALAILETFANEGGKSSDIFTCAIYCSVMGYQGKAITYFEKAKDVYKSLSQQNPMYIDSVLVTSGMLVGIYGNNNQYDEAESLYREVLNKYQNLHIKDIKHQYILAQINELHALHCYYNGQRFDESYRLFKKVIKDYRRLSHKAPQYRENLGHALITYANAIPRFLNDNRIKINENKVEREQTALYKEGIAIFRDLAKNNPQDYEIKLADVLMHVASNLWQRPNVKDFGRDSEEELISEALMIYEKLAKEDPDKFESYYISVLLKLPIQFSRFDEETIYRDIIDICQNSTSKFKSGYGTFITLAYALLADNYVSHHRDENLNYQEAIKRLKESIEISERYNVKIHHVAKNVLKLAELYKELGQDADSNREYKRGIGLYKGLIEAEKTDIKTRGDEIEAGESMVELAELYKQLELYNDCEIELKGAIDYYENQTHYFLDKDSVWILGAKEKLAALYRNQKRYGDTEKQYIGIIEGYKRLFKQYRREGSEWFSSGLQYAWPAVQYIDSLACLYEEMAQYKKAEEQYKDGIRMLREMTGIRSHYISDIAKRLEKLADLHCWAIQEYEESEKEYREAYSIRLSICKGDIKPYFIAPDFGDDEKYKEKLCIVLQKLVYNDILLKKYEQALKDVEETLAMGLPLEVVKQSLVLAKLFNGQYQEAEKFFLQLNAENKAGFISDLRFFVNHGTMPEEYIDDIERFIKKFSE